jgi:hypothetical protein
MQVVVGVIASMHVFVGVLVVMRVGMAVWMNMFAAVMLMRMAMHVSMGVAMLMFVRMAMGLSLRVFIVAMHWILHVVTLEIWASIWRLGTRGQTSATQYCRKCALGCVPKCQRVLAAGMPPSPIARPASQLCSLSRAAHCPLRSSQGVMGLTPKIDPCLTGPTSGPALARTQVQGAGRFAAPAHREG